MKKTKLVIFLFISLISLSISSTAMSLAWFSNNDHLQIESVDIHFESVDNLKISTKKDGEYVDKLVTSDLNKVDAFVPVSSMFRNNWINEKPKFPKFYDQYASQATSFVGAETEHPYVVPVDAEAASGYFSQEFYLKSTGSFYATLDTSNNASFLSYSETLNKERAKKLANDPDFNNLSEEEILNSLNELPNAMRVSVLVDYKDKYQYYVYDPNKTEDTLFGGPIDSNYCGLYDYKYNTVNESNYEVLYGEVEGRENIVYKYNNNEERMSNPTSLSSGHASNTYTIDMDASIDAGVKIAKENSISFAESETIKANLMKGNTKDVEEKLLLIPLDPDIPTRIVVSIYLEGWDVDCVNSTMGASFDCQLTFGLLDRNII